MKDYYKILNLDKKASGRKLKRSHHKSISSYLQGKSILKEFQEQIEAYYVLRNPRSRVIYDLLHLFEFDPTNLPKKLQGKEPKQKWVRHMDKVINKSRNSALYLSKLPREKLQSKLKSIETYSFLEIIWIIIKGIIQFILEVGWQLALGGF